MEDHHHAILELGGQVEGEPGPRQTGLGRRDLLQHVVHDVEAGGGSVGLEEPPDVIETTSKRRRSSHQVLLTLTFRNSRRGILMAFVATSLRHKDQSHDLLSCFQSFGKVFLGKS